MSATQEGIRPPSVTVAPIWRRRPLAITAVVCGLLSTLVGRNSISDDEHRYHNQECTVIDVDDDNALLVDLPDGDRSSTLIRLWGVDMSGTDVDLGAFLRDRVVGRQVTVILAPHCSRDEKGRLLAYVQLADGGESLNETLLANGHARAAHRPENPMTPAYLALERKARRAGLGLWAGRPAPDSPSPESYAY